jgi:hypothetical protein
MTWLSTVMGFLIGFLVVYGWQAAGYQIRPSPQQAVTAQTEPVAPVQPVTEAKKAGAQPAKKPVETGPPKTAEELIFEPRLVEQQLKGPLGRLEKLLQQAELKSIRSQQVGAPDGDTVVRVEVPPLSVVDVEAFWRQAEQEMLKLATGLKPYFLARVEDMKDQFLSGPSQSAVLFVKQRAARVSGEPSVLYWYFQTPKPSQYALNADGSIGMPANQQLPEGTAWFDPSTFKAPQRLKHLAVFKYN